VLGLVIFGGLLAVAVARSRRASRPMRAPARPEAAAAPVHPLPTHPPQAVPQQAPAPVAVAVTHGATALAPAPEVRPAPEQRPALHLVAAAPPEPEPLPEPLFEPERAPALEPVRWETCGVKLWRGYVSWQLVAESSTTPSTVALSPAFRARRAKEVVPPVPTQNEAARKAVEALQAMLEAHGWERVGDRDAWYEGRFRRRT
jgi:hypothetical protein